MNSERREHERLRSDGFQATLESRGRKFICPLVDISAGGAKVRLDGASQTEAFAVGSSLRFSLPLWQDAPLRVHARVRWATCEWRVVRLGAFIGIQFEGLDDAQLSRLGSVLKKVRDVMVTETRGVPPDHLA